MRAAGNIPVDRKNKNNQSLFKGSFEGQCNAFLSCYRARDRTC
jgi:1-acyl-sn-glycerol-3-phosphate acyltransferase